MMMVVMVTVAIANFGGSTRADDEPPTTKPNLIFILADDLGYGDLGCYGQTEIQTPHLDRMAAEGLRFTNFYAGNTVCAPSRSVLMTGLHMGHTPVRGNANEDMSIQSLSDCDITVAEVLRDVGYTNGLIGKWGLGEIGDPGHPLKQGFDRFYGYLNQVHAHNYYPEFVWDGLNRHHLNNVVLPRGGVYGGFAGGSAIRRVQYTADLFADQAIQFVEQNARRPFFLYLSLTSPHANNEATRMNGDGAEVPDYGIYADRDWSDATKGQAAMITRMDGDVGRLIRRLRDLQIDKNTLVFFTSDNGPHNEAGHDVDVFDPNGPFRGMKRSLYDGGIRVPAIAWWPGTVAADTQTDHVSYAGDWMATAAELTEATLPDVPHLADDSVSFAPTLLGNTADQKQHDYLYWEFYEQGGRQAVRFGPHKAIREPMFSGEIELYDVVKDRGESDDLATAKPALVRRAAEMMDAAHTPDPDWKIRGRSR